MACTVAEQRRAVNTGTNPETSQSTRALEEPHNSTPDILHPHASGGRETTQRRGENERERERETRDSQNGCSGERPRQAKDRDKRVRMRRIERGEGNKIPTAQ